MTDNRANQNALKIGETLNRMVEPLQPLVQLLQRVSEAMAPIVEAAAPLVERFTIYNKFIDSVRPTGWLPYHTVSLDIVEECGEDVALLEARLTEFYENNWESIRHDIETRLDSYQISEDSKATFREALAAHDLGHYRCVCRVLFPEIDREFRIHFFEDAAGLISSEKMLKRLTNCGFLENFLPREAYGWILLDRLVHHLYERVDDGNRARYEQDYVPNRHAAIHGLVRYGTFKHSINMIIMADYIFQVLTSTAEFSPAPQ